MGEALGLAGAQVHGASQSREAGRHVHHGATRKVEDAQIEQKAVRMPRHVGERSVDEQGEEHHEQDVAPESDAPRHAAGEEGGCDDGKLELKEGEEQKGEAAANVRVGLQSDVAKVEEGEGVADDAADAVAEAQAEADDDPHHADDTECDEALQHGGDDILAVHHAPVEEGEARGHEEDECTGDDHPGDVSGTRQIHRAPVRGLGFVAQAENGQQDESHQRNEVDFLSHAASFASTSCRCPSFRHLFFTITGFK